MRVLIVQLVPPDRLPARPVFVPELGVAAAMLTAEGFDPALAALPDGEPGPLRQAVARCRPTAWPAPAASSPSCTRRSACR